MTLPSLRFYLLRLRNASPAELGCRMKQALAARQVRWIPGKGTASVTAVAAAAEGLAGLSMPELHGRIDPDVVREILRGERFTLSADPAVLKLHEARLRGRSFASIAPAGAGCDIRQVWEPARLQHVTLLVAAVRNGCGESRDIARFARESAGDSVMRWIDRNPFPKGPHHASAMECGLRVPVFFYCLKELAGRDAADREILLESIHRHAWWISRRLSLHSSLGNHTIAEGVGLIFAGAVFRESRAGRQWLKTGCALLEEELPHQVLADGGPAEQAFAYHRFVLDLYWLAVDFLERNRLRDCSGWKPFLRRGEAFLAAFGDEVPAIGDADGGFAVAPGLAPGREAAPAAGECPIRFEDAGYTVARTDDGLSLTFDHGPLGMAPLFNHGHADALSVTVSRNGAPIMIDPGTYRYNGAPEFRRYFKGTRAHNTVVVDGQDQAVQETGFLWSRPYSAQVTRFERFGNGFLVEAEHDGYARLAEPVTHMRTIRFVRDAGFVLQDRFEGSGTHDFEINFHLHPDAEVEHTDRGWRFDRDGEELWIESLGGSGLLLSHGGRANPPLGWYSPSYGIKRPACVLQESRRGAPGDVVFTTLVFAGSTASRSELEETACRLSPVV